jgi:hypothetical protein
LNSGISTFRFNRETVFIGQNKSGQGNFAFVYKDLNRRAIHQHFHRFDTADKTGWGSSGSDGSGGQFHRLSFDIKSQACSIRNANVCFNMKKPTRRLEGQYRTIFQNDICPGILSVMQQGDFVNGLSENAESIRGGVQSQLTGK